MTADQLSRRHMLAGTPSVIAGAAAATVPAAALAETQPADAALVALKAQHDEALQLAESATAAADAVWRTIPSWVHRRPNAPLDHWAFADWNGHMERLDLGAIHDGNDHALERATRDGRAAVMERCQGRLRWMRAYERRQRKAKEASGIVELNEAADAAWDAFAEARTRLLSTPAEGFIGMAIKLEVMERTLRQILANEQANQFAKISDKHWNERTGIVAKTLASLQADAARLGGVVTS